MTAFLHSMRFSKKLKLVLPPLFVSFFIAFAQNSFDATRFAAISSHQERYNYMLSLNYNNFDSTNTVNFLNQSLPIIVEKKDTKSYLYWLYLKFSARGKLKLSYNEVIQLLEDTKKKAKAEGYPENELVASHYLSFEQFYAKTINPEVHYTNILKNYGLMEEIGFEKFKPFRPEALFMHMGNYMRELDDNEKAFQFLKTAEKFIQPTKDGDYYYTNVLNNIQTYYSNKKDYNNVIIYAQKIYDFHNSLNPTQDFSNWRSRFWQGLSSLDIASALIEMGKVEEGEKYSIRAYELCKLNIDENLPSADRLKIVAEYDALQVLIDIKLKLRKYTEAEQFLQRAELLKKYLNTQHVHTYFKPLKLYRNYVKLYEAKNDLANAHRYAKLADMLQDSLNHRNDAHKLEAIKQRIEAEKYHAQINIIETEKSFQLWVRNGAIFILFLITLLALVNYRRIHHKRKIALLELTEAHQQLLDLTNNYKDKSEQTDKLRLEIERLSQTGEKSEFLEQLSQSTILTDEDWLRFKNLFEKVHPHFIAEQKATFPDLTNAELRLLVLEKLGLSTQEMANMLGVSRNTINQTKVRLRKKIG